jgi:hypothetical protein
MYTSIIVLLFLRYPSKFNTKTVINKIIYVFTNNSNCDWFRKLNGGDNKVVRVISGLLILFWLSKDHINVLNRN